MALKRALVSSLLIFVACVASLAAARPATGTGTRTAVILPGSDAAAARAHFSSFLDSLQARGHTLTLVPANLAVSTPLIEHEQLAFDHLLVLAPNVPSFGGALKMGNLIDFINAGGNVLLCASSALSEPIRDFAYEFSIDFDEAGTAVFDHFHALDSKDPTTFASTNIVSNATHVVSQNAFKDHPIVFRGVAHRITGKNPLAFPVLVGHGSSYAYDTSDTSPLVGDALLGSSIAMVSAFQARNNARVIFSGSAELFSDAFFKLKVRDGKQEVDAGNAEFANQISRWVFQEKSVLKIGQTKHHRYRETNQHGIYRIKDNMEYSARILEWNGDSWTPFVANDVQFEAVMLDPYVRKTMTHNRNGVFATKFTLPDQHGVFTFRVAYKRHGMTFIEASETVQVRPFRHDQYPRFLLVAFPYYANIFSMLAGFIVLSMLFLYNREPTPNHKTKAE